MPTPRRRRRSRWLPRRPLPILLASLLVAALATVPGTPAAGEDLPFLVGTGATVVNPDGPICIGGYGMFCGRPSTGVRDDLTARALAISSAEDRGTTILVTSTAVGLFAAYKDTFGDVGIDPARRRIAEATGIDPHQVVVVSDHSHAGPDTIGIWGGVDAAYLQRLTDGIVTAGIAAFESRVPATMSWGAVDGTTHGYALDSSYDRGPTDDAAMDNELRVLFAHDADDDPLAMFVNYAPHATVCEKCDDELSGDWTAWAADEIATRWGAAGFGAVGVLGSTDWNKAPGGPDEREAEARARLVTLITAAEADRTPVVGDVVAARSTFIREVLAQPVLGLNYLPGVSDPTGQFGEGDLRIDRTVSPPHATPGTVGTWGGAVRIGDVFISTFPGEPFPQLQDALRDSVEAPVHFVLGAAQDFLGYMVADEATYTHTFEEGGLWAAGCPEEELYGVLDVDHDGACPDHWSLMVSPTIGLHLACTATRAAADMGMATTDPDPRCPALTATDGLLDPLAATPTRTAPSRLTEPTL